ncbi:MAG: Omp28 family outer membrane lipoprotein [Bacteroidota bacterium]
MLNKYILLLSLLLLIAVGCDKVEPPFLENTSDKCGNDTLSVAIRKVLVEDYTGHTCGNCPRAAEALETLKSIYCDHIVTIGVHVGFFAEPKNNTDSSYSYDFRTQTGNELEAQWGNGDALPNGMINRKEVDGNKILSYAGWGTAVDQILFDQNGNVIPPDISINITNTYDAVSGMLNTSIESGFINPLEGAFRLSVFLIEDSIITWQKDYEATPSNIPDYVHRHVLRSAINNTWGDIIVTGSVSSGSVFTKAYSIVLDPEWVAGQCSVVAFVYDDAEIIQVEETHVIN